MNNLTPAQAHKKLEILSKLYNMTTDKYHRELLKAKFSITINFCYLNK